MAFDYSSRDYSTIKTDLLARAARVAPEWTDRDPSDFGMVLVDLWASMGDVIHYYVDRAAGESTLPTATQRESVLAFANLLDYEPGGRTSAQATVVLSNSSDVGVAIPRHTRLIARYDNRTYQAYIPTTYTVPANSSITATVREGTIVVSPAETLTSAANGLSGQRYTLINEEVVHDSAVITVYEDGITPTEYRRVTRLSNAASGDRVYTLRTTADNLTEVVFGTNVRGFIPPSGSTITAVYAYSSGAAGNLPANSITAFRDTTPAGIIITSSTAFTGGVNEESIVSMKSSIPALATAQNRAVTESDFVNLALGVDGVSKAAIEYTPNPAGGASAGNASVTVYAQVNRAHDYLTTTDTSQTVSSDTQSAVVSFIQPYALLGVDVVAAPTVTWTPIDIAVTVYVTETAVASFVETAVEEALDNLFRFDAVSFGHKLSLGKIYRTIINQYGVDYANVTLFDEQGGSAVETNITVDSTSIPKKGNITVTVVGGITST